MKNIERELKDLISVTNESNALYINTRVQRHSFIQAETLVNSDTDCLIMERVKSTRANDASQRHLSATQTSPQQCVSEAGYVKRDNDVDILYREQVENSEMKSNGYGGREHSRERTVNNCEDRRKTNQCSSEAFFEDRSKRHHCNASYSQSNRDATYGRGSAEDANSESFEGSLYHIVKVKHPKNFKNLVRYTAYNEEVRKPLLMVLTVIGITTISSLSPIRPFLIEIIKTYDDDINTDQVLIWTSILNIIGYLLCASTINRLGKRHLIMLSLALNAVASFTLGYFAHTHVAASSVPIYCIYVNSFLQGYGILQLPWILMSEVFPLEIRGIACGMSAGFSYLLNFCFTKTYLSMTSMFGLAFTIYIYSATGVFGILYIYFYMPETENKTLHQIQQYFLKR